MDVRTHPPGWIYELVRLITTWISLFLYRERAIDTHNVPADGPLILAPNHFSNMDHFFSGAYLRRKIQFMAKSQLFGNPILDYIFRVGGVFPIRRGHHDEEAFKTAHAIFARGGCVLMYCEGGRSRTGELGEAKPGVGRLALESGVPVVPVAIHGSAGVRKWRKLHFPQVTIQYGEPITFAVVAEPTREQQLAAAEQIFARPRDVRGARLEGLRRRFGSRPSRARVSHVNDLDHRDRRRGDRPQRLRRRRAAAAPRGAGAQARPPGHRGRRPPPPGRRAGLARGPGRPRGRRPAREADRHAKLADHHAAEAAEQERQAAELEQRTARAGRSADFHDGSATEIEREIRRSRARYS